MGAVMGGLMGANAGVAGPAMLVTSGFWAGIGLGIDALVPARRIYASTSRGALTVAPILGGSRKGVRLAWRF